MRLGRLAAYVKDHGIRESAHLAADRLLDRKRPEVSYEEWLNRNRPSSGDYRRMERTAFPYSPVIGVRASMPEAERVAFFQSLDMQIYRRFRSLKGDPSVEYALLVNDSCSLRPDLLWECARMLDMAGPGQIDLIYFDSDRIGGDGRKCQPAFRPEYDPALLSRVNYMGDVVLVRTGAAMEAGLPGPGEDAFHSFLKKICLGSKTGRTAGPGGSIRHIPKILYHTQGTMEMPAAGELSPRAFGREASSASGHVMSHTRENEALVSVLIPNKDHAQDLEKCVDSLRRNNTWTNLEIVILENQSSMAGTFELYRHLREEDPRIRILEWNRPFNYSAINNYGASQAKGEYLLLLNNDTQILEPESIALLQTLASEPETGAAGALLLYPDKSVQHGGIILGHGGIAGHAWEGELLEQYSAPYPGLVLSHTHNVSAVTGACMMLRRSVWEAAGGMDESLAVTFNDVDLCMRLRKEGRNVLMCPGACLTHYESASRGYEDSPEKVERFHREIGIFVRRWSRELEMGDPFYSPSLTLQGRSWTCRDDLREGVKPYLKYLRMTQG